MIRRLAALLACIALGVGVAFAQTVPAAPPGTVTFTAQLLDLRDGYVYFTSGDAFKLADAYRLTDYDTGAPTTTIPAVKWFARATLDPATKEVLILAVTKRRVPVTPMQQFHQFAIVASTPAPAPELNRPGLTGRMVSVVFEVTVPPTTQLTDNVYISTDAGGWNAQEIKLDRVNAYLYRASRSYASGTKFAWRVTRGSWNSVERGENNLDPEPHQFTVRDVDALAARATVYHWSDDNPTQQGVGPNSIPTPFNANPFGGRNGVVVPPDPDLAADPAAMIGRIATAAAAAVGFALFLAAAAGAASTVRLRANDVAFLAGSLAIVAHGSVAVDAKNLGSGSADAAYVDLRKNRLVLAGHAQLGAFSGDALAVDLEAGRVDALRVEDGATAGDFDFPDVDPRAVFIRARRVTIVPNANARFTPASFPTSVGAPPVPTYLYTFASSSGFAAQSLPGASFDQPYGLVGSPSALLAAHLRYVQATGLDVALDDHLVDGNRSFLVTSVDAPERSTRLLGLNAYRKIGSRYTATVDGVANAQTFFFHTAQTAAFGPAGARLDTSFFSGAGASSDLTLRGPDRPLVLGLTYRLQGDLGVQLQRGGVLAQLPDAASYQTLWHHGLDLFVATPQVRGPLHTTMNATFDTGETWYAFPHTHGTFSATGTMTRRFGALTATAIYAQAEDLESFGALQGLFYPPPATLYVTPDGTPWPGLATFAGASTARLYELGLQLVTSPSTTYRMTYAHTNDFPQFRGFGRPVDSVALDVRFRLAPNIGLDVGRSYDFAWGGTRWVPTWVFAILP